MKLNRTAVAGLTLGASALIGLASHEGWCATACIPVKGDRWTLGFGDATGVKEGDKTDPVRGLVRLGFLVGEKERQMKACLGDVELTQYEWDAYVSFTYNVGVTAFCRSSIVKKLKQAPPDYAGACADLNRWVFFQGRPLPGLVARRREEYLLCMGQK